MTDQADRNLCTAETCSDEAHDHTTTQDNDGNDLDVAIPSTCPDCDRPSHWDETTGCYYHDNDGTVICTWTSGRA